MHRIMKKVVLLSLALLSGQAHLAAQSAKEIVLKSEEQLRGSRSSATLEIKTVRPTWERTMEAKTWSLGLDKNIILITAPARDRGTVFLKRDKEIWNYVPTIERSVKLPPSMMMQSWMGTDFSNDDLVNESSSVVDYTHEIVGETTVQGRPCWQIEMMPKPNAPVVWGKVVTYVSKADYLQMKGEFYDEDGYLINTMEAFDIQDLGGRTLPTRIRMKPEEETGHSRLVCVACMSNKN